MAKEMTEEQIAHLTRNALVVAGHEMGATGDHWPVIKSTAHSIMKDFENFKIEKDVFEEVRKHYQRMIKQLEVLCDESPNNLKPHIRSTISTLLEVYSATFTPVKRDDIYVDENSVAPHIKRAANIIQSLEGSNE